jgi:membrane glycosyltransferase
VTAPSFLPISFTPPKSPLEFPRQSFAEGRLAGRFGSPGLAARRFVLFGATLALTLGALVWTGSLLGVDGLAAAEIAMLALSSVLFAMIALGFLSASAGFLAMLADRASPRAQAAPTVRTAILVPVYNEDPTRVLSAVQAMHEDLDRAGVIEAYDFFVLSDTRDALAAAGEAAGLARIRARLGRAKGLYYRRRQHNTDAKAGNIADWVRQWGGAYELMLVLDADSLMSAEVNCDLTRSMEVDPRLGLLQTTPMIVGAETPFARFHQFASWLYGPMFSRGLAWWSGSEGNYWGHNAIVRVRAFAESAGLPHLPGRAPFGGHVQSHDFVEAALLRRRGWGVRMLPPTRGSYEETPPCLMEAARRDRRWCQGNLQHARLLGAAGLHWISRIHLLRGMLAYLAAPLWLATLPLGLLAWSGLGAAGGRQLLAIFLLTMSFLLGPKLMALVLALRDGAVMRQFGGAGRLMLGALAETIAAMLVAPVLMLLHAKAVAEVLLGRDSGWGAQRRDGEALAFRQAWRAHRLHVAFGVLGILGALLADWRLLAWTAPITVGLVASPVLTWLATRDDLGRALGAWRLLQTPAEAAPDPVLARAAELRGQQSAAPAFQAEVDLLLRASPAVYGAVREGERRDDALMVA